MKRRRYRNPPIEEAICELQLAPGPDWDLTIPGRLYERIKDKYPGKPQHQSIMEAKLRSGAEGGTLSLGVKEGGAKLFFLTLDGRRRVAVGPDVLSIHMFRPYYPGWEDFRPRIEDAWRHYQEVAEPVGVRRIGIRYINRILLPSETVDLSRYFTVPPNAPPGFPETMSSFFHRTEFSHEDTRIRLITTFASAKAPQGSSAFLLDLDVIWVSDEDPLSVAEVMSMVGILRDRERDAFERLITDNAREVFDSEGA